MAEPSSTPALTPEYLAQDHGYIIRDTAIAFIVLVTVSTGLRAWSRHIQGTRWLWGDVFATLSWIFNLSTCTAILLGVRYGAGKHIVTLSQDDLISFQKVIWLAVPTSAILAVMWPKLVILDLYLHVFINKYARWASYACGTLMIVNAILFEGLTIGQCRPIRRVWNKEVEGSCLDVSTMFVWTTFANIITDFVMLVIPIPVVLRLQQKWQTKLGILLTFMVGGLGQAVSIVRFYEFYVDSVHTSTPDPTYSINTVFVWTIVEPGTYHLVACFLTYQTLFRWLARESYLSVGWSRVSSWVSRSGSRASSVMSTTDAPLFPRSPTSEKRPVSPLGARERELESGESFGPKRGYIAKIDAQGDSSSSNDGAETEDKENNYGITVKRDFEVRSEKAPNTHSNWI